MSRAEKRAESLKKREHMRDVLQLTFLKTIEEARNVSGMTVVSAVTHIEENRFKFAETFAKKYPKEAHIIRSEMPKVLRILRAELGL